MALEETPVPAEIGRAGEHDIRIEWRDGHHSVYPARMLRQKCPCAMCVDELTGVRTLDQASVPQTIAPQSLELVGRYAIRVYWNDQHSSGIYTFKLLRRLCPCQACNPTLISSKG
ncbi:MAG: DUF971 domain-containing protein [Acidobacteriota bacterium]